MGYNYQEIIEELGRKGSVLGIETMKELLERLHHPEDNLKIIHTAGTNGKGSTLAFLSGILEESGYQVGRYISPTISCYEERFQINGRYISEDALEHYFRLLKKVSDEMAADGLPTPTLFEAETAIAFLYFQEENVDYALIEVGMGGLTDATNAIRHPFMTIITSISEDHKAFLGNTLEEIAAQKAGILKENVPAVVAINGDRVRNVMITSAQACQAPCEFLDSSAYTIIEETQTGARFLWETEEYEIYLPGRHQIENSLTALTAAKKIKALEKNSKISIETMKRGLQKTRWPGRLQLLKEDPLLYLDGAHNPDGARKLFQFLEKHFTNKKIVYIMGVLKDKEYPKMLSELMPLASSVYTFTPKNARGLDAARLAEEIRTFAVPATVCEDVNVALQTALQEKADVFVLCGSLSFIEELRL